MRKLVVGITIASLMGCSMGHRDPVEVKQALNESINQANSRALEEIPSSVEADLMPNLDSNVSSDNGTSKRFRIQANAVEARRFLCFIGKRDRIQRRGFIQRFKVISRSTFLT